MNEDVKELANVIFHEARGESRVGQAAVGHVVMNRLRSGKWGSSVRAVAWSRGQFQNLRYHKVPQVFLDLALGIIEGKVANPVGNAMFFAAKRVAKRGMVLGNHRFR